MKLKVFYGFSKLTKKAVRKPELAVWFENDNRYRDGFITQKMLVVHERYQTKKEQSDALNRNRMFVKYNYFIDDKPWNGDIDKVLEHNFIADENNVSEKERLEIKEKLKKSYFSFYNVKKKAISQLRFNF